MTPPSPPSVGPLIRRAAVIGLVAAAMMRLVVWAWPAAEESYDYREVALVKAGDTGDPIASEADVFSDLMNGLSVVSTTEQAPHISVASIALRRSRRAYPGAPPFIPHPVRVELQRSQDCKPCHRLGGYMPSFVTYAPRTPHPKFGNCMQCHVAVTTSERFRPIDWQTMEWPDVDGRRVEETPPVIPHPLWMRTNCLTCHGGPAAAVEIKTSHPEWVNCRQCHLLMQEEGAVFSRPVDPGGGA